MLYTLYQNNNRKSAGYEKFYARAAYLETVNTDDLAQRISYSTTATKADVLAVLDALVHEMNKALINGNKVKLNGFGIFKVGIKSTGVDAIDQFSVAQNIVGAHVNFLPIKSLNRATGASTNSMLDGLTFKQK